MSLFSFCSLGEYLRWWKVWGTLPVVSWSKAAQHFRNRDFRLAAAEYKKGLKKHKIHPARHCAKLDCAYSLLQIGDNLEAKALLEEICSEKIDLADAYIVLSNYCLSGDEKLEALNILKSATETFPKNALLYANYAMFVWFNQLKPENQKELEHKLVFHKNSSMPNSRVWAISNTALAARARIRGENELAESLLNEVFSSGYAPTEAYLLFYYLLSRRGQTERALDNLNRALRLSPKDPRPLIEYAKRLSRAKDKPTLTQAAQLAKRACELSFYRNPQALLLLSDIEKSLGSSPESDILEVHSYMLKSEREVNMPDTRNLEVQLERLRRN